MRAPSPTYFCTSSLPMTRMKQASVLLATARASSVLPVPAHCRPRVSWPRLVEVEVARAWAVPGCPRCPPARLRAGRLAILHYAMPSLGSRRLKGCVSLIPVCPLGIAQASGHASGVSERRGPACLLMVGWSAGTGAGDTPGGP